MAIVHHTGMVTARELLEKRTSSGIRSQLHLKSVCEEPEEHADSAAQEVTAHAQ